MTIRSNILVPKATKGWVSHNSVLGTNSYDLNNLYSPDTAFRQSCVLDLASPKYEPNKTTIFDKSGYNNHGTITGATWDRLPSGLWVNRFDGVDDYIRITSSTSIKPNIITVMAWEQISGESSSLLSLDYRADTNWNDPYVSYSLNPNVGGVTYFNITVGGVRVAGQINAIINRWVLITGVFDGNNILVYNNTTPGVPAAQVGNIDYGTSLDLTLGVRSPYTLGEYFTGKAVLFRIYNVALSAAEITQIFNSERHLFGV